MIPKNLFDPLPSNISGNLIILGVRHHSKASEAYVDVSFVMEEGKTWDVSIPVNYRRTGLDAQTKEDCIEILEQAYEAFKDPAMQKWSKSSREFWSWSKKTVTRPFFEVLSLNVGKWVCQGCTLPPNPNWARRTQDIKDFGFTLATDTRRVCKKCRGRRTHLMLLPVPRSQPTGYETWSITLRKRILKVLGCFDAYEGRVLPEASLLPDHKFPEIRWDENTRKDNPETMPDDDIRAKFQLLNNQRNQQKREACRSCYQTGKRGKLFGINFFYKGDENWPANAPKKGTAAESGCVGCGWYDMNTWRSTVNNVLLDLLKRGH